MPKWPQGPKWAAGLAFLSWLGLEEPRSQVSTGISRLGPQEDRGYENGVPSFDGTPSVYWRARHDSNMRPTDS